MTLMSMHTAPCSANQVAQGAPAEIVLWGPDLLGLLFYVFVEYTRIAIVYPALAPLQLGKVSLLAALTGSLFSRTAGQAEGNRIMKFLIMLLGLFTLVSGLLASYGVIPASDLWNIPEQLIIVFVIGRVVANDWRAKRFLFVLLLLMLKVAQHGLRTYAVEHAQTTDEMAFVRFGIIGGGRGFYDNSADLGVAMCVMFGLAVALFQADIARKWKMYFLLCASAFGALILVCGSRGAIVGGAAIVLATTARSARKSWALVILLTFVIGIFFLMPHASRDRFKSAEDYKNDETANHRVELWMAGLRMWHDYPVLGVGPANFAYVRAAGYRIAAMHDSEAYVCHSLYIQVLSELGTLGSIAAAGVILMFFRITGRIRRHLRECKVDGRDWQFCLASGLQLAMLGYLVSGAFVSVFWYPHIWVLCGLAIGLNTAVAARLNLLAVDGNPRSALLRRLEGAHELA